MIRVFGRVGQLREIVTSITRAIVPGVQALVSSHHAWPPSPLLGQPQCALPCSSVHESLLQPNVAPGSP